MIARGGGRIAAAACSAMLAAVPPLGAQDSVPPPAGPMRPFEAPRPATFTLGNGVRVVVVERGPIPIVSVAVMVEAGTAYEPARQAGLATLTATLLREGTVQVPGPELARSLGEMGSEWTTFAGLTHAGVTLSTVPSRLPDALQVVAAALRSPAFPADAVERRRGEALAGLEQRTGDARVVGFDLLTRSLFGAQDPNGRPLAGTRPGVQALTRDDVVRWHREHYAPARTTLVVVGPVAPGRARALAEAAFGSWRAQPAPRRPPAPPRARPGASPRVILVDRPGATQTGIVVGSATVPATDPLYFPLLVANRVLGVGTSSRLSRNLRERRGFTYGVQSYVEPRRGVGVLSIEGLVRADATDSALVEISKELGRLAAGDVTPEEVSGAVSGLAGSFPTSIATVQALRTRVTNLLQWEAPLTFYADYRERLAAVTAPRVNAAARRLFDPGGMTWVVVGDLRTIEGPVRALNLGTVEVWDATGVPAAPP